jgi:dTDP-glucose 4,6-dehydratase
MAQQDGAGGRGELATLAAMGSLAGARALVTGAAGFIGSHLVRHLVAAGAEVHALTHAVSSVYPLRLADLRDRIIVHEADLADRGALDVVVARARPDVVFHLGAYTHVYKSWDRAGECVQTNVAGTLNLLEALGGRFQRFVNVGTSEIYGTVPVPFREDGPTDPASPYAVTKGAAEQLCRIYHRRHGWPIVLVRPFNAYGPYQTPDRVVAEVIGRALKGQELLMTSGRQTREFNYVADTARGIALAATAEGVEGALINIGCGVEVTIAELARTILRLMGDPIEPRLGALPDRANEIWRMCCDNTRARELLGWSPAYDLEAGLSATIAWYRAEAEANPASPFLP